MNSNPKCDFWLWNNAYNRNNNCNNSDIIAIIVTVWAHSTAMAVPPIFHSLVFTHRMGVHLNAVHRTYLQGLQSCSAKTNNAYNRNNNAYNSTGTLHQAAFRLCAFQSMQMSRHSSSTLTSHSSMIGSGIAVCTFKFSRCRHLAIIENNRGKNEQ